MDRHHGRTRWHAVSTLSILPPRCRVLEPSRHPRRPQRRPRPRAVMIGIMSAPTIPAAQALRLDQLITPTGQGLTEHTSPFDAMVMVLEGRLTLTIGGSPVDAAPGTIVRMPAGVAHAVD